MTSLITLRGLRATGIVAGECSSAALWPFAACQRRLVTPLSVLLFHNMKWQSEENVGLLEAAEWARHFGQLEKDMDVLLARLFGIAPEKIVDVDSCRPIRQRSGVGRGGTGRTGRVEAAGPGREPAPQVMTQGYCTISAWAMNPTWSISPARRWPASSRSACP